MLKELEQSELVRKKDDYQYNNDILKNLDSSPLIRKKYLNDGVYEYMTRINLIPVYVLTNYYEQYIIII